MWANRKQAGQYSPPARREFDPQIIGVSCIGFGAGQASGHEQRREAGQDARPETAKLGGSCTGGIRSRASSLSGPSMTVSQQERLQERRSRKARGPGRKSQSRSDRSASLQYSGSRSPRGKASTPQLGTRHSLPNTSVSFRQTPATTQHSDRR